jgi:Cupin domain
MSSPYAINLDTRFAPLETIDVQELVDACRDEWYNQTLCRVNDCVVRLGVMQGQFHWHKHDDQDEFFYVIEGRWVIDLEGRTVELGPRARAHGDPDGGGRRRGADRRLTERADFTERADSRNVSTLR